MFPRRLKEARIEKKLTQEELAKRVNTKKTTISNYETGYSSPSQEMLSDLADILGKSTDWLLGRTNDPNVPDESQSKKTLKVDDEIFFDGYLKASEEEKEKMREYWFREIKKIQENPPIEEDNSPSAWDIVREKK